MERSTSLLCGNPKNNDGGGDIFGGRCYDGDVQERRNQCPLGIGDKSYLVLLVVDTLADFVWNTGDFFY